MENTSEQQPPKRKPGRPRKYPPKPPKPKPTKEELSEIRRAASMRALESRRKSGKMGGRPKGTTGNAYHNDNIAQGEPRVQMSVLKSSADVFRKLANNEKIPIIAAVKNVTDTLVEQNPTIFARAPKMEV